MESNSDTALIKEFFSTEGHTVTVTELKALTQEDRKELGASIRAALTTPEEMAA